MANKKFENIEIKGNLYVNDSVGIGTSSPDANLAIKSTTTGYENLLITRNGTNQIKFYVLANGGAGFPDNAMPITIDPNMGLRIGNGGTINAMLFIHKQGYGDNPFEVRDENDNKLSHINYLGLHAIVPVSGNYGLAVGLSIPSAMVHIKGFGASSASSSLKVENNTFQIINARDDGRVFVGTTTYDPVYATFSDYLSTKLAVQSNTNMFASFTNTVGLGLIILTSGESGNVTLQAANTADATNAQIAFKATNGHIAYGFSSLEHNDNKHNFWLNTNSDKLSILNYDTRTAGQGSNIFFHARAENGSNIYPELAAIKGLAYENAGDGTNQGYLSFYTAKTGDFGERMRITKDGNVGIATSSPSARLHVTGSGTTSATYSLKIENSS